MNIPQSFIDKFGLVPDTFHEAMGKIADNFPPGRYTTAKIVRILERKYRLKDYSDEEWARRLNKMIDGMVHEEFLEYKDGYYYGK